MVQDDPCSRVVGGFLIPLQMTTWTTSLPPSRWFHLLDPSPVPDSTPSSWGSLPKYALVHHFPPSVPSGPFRTLYVRPSCHWTMGFQGASTKWRTGTQEGTVLGKVIIENIRTF